MYSLLQIQMHWIFVLISEAVDADDNAGSASNSSVIWSRQDNDYGSRFFYAINWPHWTHWTSFMD